ncbi:MAG: class 1 fructose-bisphosphatase [Myxococcales bacterium]|nr:class 1 fructose-bisphosphatase [Myxococcales bacterium]
MPGLVTIQQHIISNQRRHSEATGEFSFLLSGITIATKVLASKVRKAGLVDIFGSTGDQNVQGETVQKLDRIANDLLMHCIGYRRSVGALASEENETVVDLTETGRTGKYLVLFDPLDGSSNIDVNIPTGTIFSILVRPDRSEWAEGGDVQTEILQAGAKQVAAGYVLYSGATTLVYTTGNGVHQFVLDPEIGAYVLVQERLKVPDRKRIYSVNEANSGSFPKEAQEYLAWTKTPEAGYSSRYVGSFVADFHRILMQGGVFLYPATAKAPGGKLRLMYEANPMALLIEQAGGSAIDGATRILDKTPKKLHERTPLYIGSKGEVAIIEGFLKGRGPPTA